MGFDIAAEGYYTLRYRNPLTNDYSKDSQKPEGFNAGVGTSTSYGAITHWSSGLSTQYDSRGWNSDYNGNNREIDVRRTMLVGYNNKEVIPGWYVMCNGLPINFVDQHLSIYDFIEGYGDKKFLVIAECLFYGSWTYHSATKDNISAQNGNLSFSLVDITGPWR